MREYIVTSDLARMSVAQYQPIRELDLWQLTKPKVRLYVYIRLFFSPFPCFGNYKLELEFFNLPENSENISK